MLDITVLLDVNYVCVLKFFDFFSPVIYCIKMHS
jgi:hypothetical protein